MAFLYQHLYFPKLEKVLNENECIMKDLFPFHLYVQEVTEYGGIKTGKTINGSLGKHAMQIE